jgi:hypothetical protein
MSLRITSSATPQNFKQTLTLAMHSDIRLKDDSSTLLPLVWPEWTWDHSPPILAHAVPPAGSEPGSEGPRRRRIEGG